MFSDVYYGANDLGKLNDEIKFLLQKDKYSDFVHLAKIGQGGEGVVFTVRNLNTNKLMVMKRLDETELEMEDSNLEIVHQKGFSKIIEQLRITEVGVNQIQSIVFENDDGRRNICILMEMGWLGDLNQFIHVQTIFEQDNNEG